MTSADVPSLHDIAVFIAKRNGDLSLMWSTT